MTIQSTHAASKIFLAIALAGWSAGARAAETDVRDGEVVRGVVRAARQATLTTDLNARILAIGFKEGAHFGQGDALLVFDCRRYEAELASATAKATAEELAHQNMAALQRGRAVGAIETKIALAKAEGAKADADAIAKRMVDCTIEAPFSGSVAALTVNVQETPGPTAPLITIVDDGPLEVDALVPSRWLKTLTVDMPFSVRLDDLALVAAARLVRIGSVVDPVSQTVKITGKLVGTDKTVRPGMSGQLSLAPPE